VAAFRYHVGAGGDDEEALEPPSVSDPSAAISLGLTSRGEAEQEFLQPSRNGSLLASPAGAVEAERDPQPPLAGMALPAADIAWAATHWEAVNEERE